MKRKLLLLSSILSLLSSCYVRDWRSESDTYVNSSPINIPNLHLKAFSKERKDVLLNYLASSSEWHVTSINGSLLALERDLDPKGAPCQLPMALGLPSSYPEGRIPFGDGGLFFNFSPEVGQSKYVEPENRVQEGTTTSLKMKERKVNPPYTSYELVVENQDKSLELYKGGLSDNISSKGLNNILTKISRQLEKLDKSTPGNSQEIDPSILPPGSVKYSQEQIVSIRRLEPKSPRSNRYTISGYINLGKKGFVYVKVINKKTGEKMLGDTASTNAEYVGWSSDPKKKFNFCLGINPAGSMKDFPNFPAHMQLWFHPSDGSQEFIVAQHPILVHVREH